MVTCFNSSVGILVVRTERPTSTAIMVCEFQFLGRNSGRSDAPRRGPSPHRRVVSIPRSEFWSFGLRGIACRSWLPELFQFLGRNSGRSDFALQADGWWLRRFQFLGRNSGRSDLSASVTYGRQIPKFQFLGRNSGRSDYLLRELHGPAAVVSIPRSEFWSFGPRGRGHICPPRPSFNSSVGILVVRTYPSLTQSDSIAYVSIPRSEFWLFGPGSVAWADCSRVACFNSSVGILVVRTVSLLCVI